MKHHTGTPSRSEHSTTRKIIRGLTFSVAMLTCTLAARADVLYESFDPSNPSVTFPTSVVAETTSFGANVYGVEFTPTESGEVTSLTAAIAVQNLVPPGGGATYQFNLFQGSTVDPFNATPIDTFSQFVNTPGGAITLITFASTDSPTLTAGTTYWLYMGMSPGEEQPLAWGIPSTSGATGTVDNASNDFLSFPNETTHSFSNTTEPAFVINGGSSTVTPEPGYSIVVAFGMALLVGVRLRAKRKAAGLS